jgi:predicted amidohydrolase YtcJ
VQTLFRNGRVYSPVAPTATALLVEDGMITWLGDDEPPAVPAATRLIDLDQGFVTPAFVDAHVHMTATGLALTSLDLARTTSRAELLAAVERAARAGRGRPIVGGGWDDSGWADPRLPTMTELDRAAYGGSVYLARVDAHSAVISSTLAGSVPGLPALTGYHTEGWVTGAAHDAVRAAALSALSATAVRDAQRAALKHAASLGIGCVHEMAGPSISSAEDLSGLLALAGAEPAPEVIGYWGELFGIEAARDLGAIGAAGDLFCDGSLGSHTAALRQPYADRPETSGELRFSTADLAEHISRCTAAGLQAGFHAIGDAAIDQVLDAVDLVTAALGRAGGSGHRLEHAEMVRDPDRLAASGLLASMQPVFDAEWGGLDRMYATRLGRHRALTLNAFSTLAAAGVPIAFGSDAPVTAMGPWAAIRAAVHPSSAESAISPRAAFTAHTRAGWRAAGRDEEGILRVGAPATFAVWDCGELAVDGPDDRVSRWSTDPRAAVPGLPDIGPGIELPKCTRTVVRGRSIFGDN